jgi:insulin receptor
VEGFVRVVLIDRANETDYDWFSFPELHEITDYLLVYRVTGLTSLGALFPNLTVIRGNSLFVDYALVVYEMFQLKVRKQQLIGGFLSMGEKLFLYNNIVYGFVE